MELEELHVLQRQALAPDDAHAVAGQGVGVRRRPEDLAEAAGREHDGLAGEDVDLTGGELVGDDATGAAVGHQQVEHVELVEEVDVLLDALLVERLQDHVPGAVGGEARPAYRRLAVLAGVAAEPTLVDLAPRASG